jgi:outer membrane protein assembly factor BamB
MRRRAYLLVLVVATAAGILVYAAQWPQFRGLRGGVAADDPALPNVWSETENVEWRVEIPGRGWSSPVV